MKRMNDACARKEENDSHTAEWLRACVTRDGFESCAKRFLCSLSLFPTLLLKKFFFACCQRDPFEILMGTGVTDHAESEYAILFVREHFLQNESGWYALAFPIQNHISFRKM